KCGWRGAEMVTSSSTTSTRGFIQASYRRPFLANLSLLPLSLGFDRTTQAPGGALPHAGRGGGSMSVTGTSQGKRRSGSVGVESIGFRLLAWGLFLLVLLILG